VSGGKVLSDDRFYTVDELLELCRWEAVLLWIRPLCHVVPSRLIWSFHFNNLREVCYRKIFDSGFDELHKLSFWILPADSGLVYLYKLRGGAVCLGGSFDQLFIVHIGLLPLHNWSDGFDELHLVLGRLLLIWRLPELHAVYRRKIWRNNRLVKLHKL
jgi:hypothetical protein